MNDIDMNDIECTVEAEMDETFNRDGCLWRGYLNYSNGTTIPFKLSAKVNDDRHLPDIRAILIVDSRKSYRKRISANESLAGGILYAMIEEAVHDFWPKKCPFGKEM